MPLIVGAGTRLWRRFRPLLAARGPALRRPLGAQLGDRRFHRSRRPDRTRPPSRRRRRRPQSAACAVRRSPRRLQPLFAEQPAVSQRALYRRRKNSGISARRRDERDALAQVRASDVVDYVGVAGLKWRALRSAFDAFKADAQTGPPAGFREIPRRARRRCCRASPASRRCGTNSTSRGGNGRSNGGSRTTPNAPRLRKGADAAEIEFVEFVQWTADRQLGGCQDLRDAARHEGRALSRRRRRRAIRRLRCLERAGRDLAPSRRRRAARSAQHRRPELGPRRLQCRRPGAEVVRAVSRDAARLDAPRRRDPARPCARAEAALSGAARLWRARRRLCADAVRGAAGGDRAGKRRATAAS